VGVFIKVWQPDFLPCGWEAERLDAMRVAAKLEIPFLTCDGEAAYKNAVADYFIAEYKRGRTPNPDVMCNKHVKFGVFLDFAKANGADFVATGHYAQVEHSDSGHVLKRGVDGSKDQSYFLWTLSQEQLGMTLLPVENSEKKEIRKEAEEAGLLTAEKKDSQGICFLGQVDIPDFLSHYVELKRGEVKTEDGVTIGHHKGALVYTVGQRQGFEITSHDTHRVPYYVTKRDLTLNIVYVSTEKPKTEVNTMLTLSELNYIQWKPTVGETLEVETRYRQKPVLCKVVTVSENSLTLTYLTESEAVSAGQSCVFYKGEVCLGGGIIL
jgi:tRNA-specific 2-thiouridylase